MLKKDEKELLDELRKIQKDKENWKCNIDFVAERLDDIYSVNVKAKALWMLGEMGLSYPQEVEPYIGEIAGYMGDEHPKLRERSINALGRIGRADKNLVIHYLDKLMKARKDEDGAVRLAFIWACENIGTNSPELFCEKLDLFYEMISDSSATLARLFVLWKTLLSSVLGAPASMSSDAARIHAAVVLL